MPEPSEGLLRRLFVDRQALQRNKQGAPGTEKEPVFFVRVYHRPGESLRYQAHHVELLGPSEAIFDLEGALPSGTVAWVETRFPVVLDRKLTV